MCIRDSISTTLNVPTLCEAYKYAAYDALQRLNEAALSPAG